MFSDTSYKWVWLLGGLLVVIDGGLTYWAVSGGHAHEGNPVMEQIITDVSIEAAVVFSVVSRLALIPIGIRFQSPEYPYTAAPSIAYTLVALGPVVWNSIVLFA